MLSSHCRIAQRREGTGTVSSRPAPFISQARNATKKEFQLPVSSARNILRNLMTGQVDRHECQTTLSVRRTHHTSTSHNTDWLLWDAPLVENCIDHLAETGVCRNHEVVRRRSLETLRTVPGHVLDRRERAVDHEEVVKPAMADDDIVRPLDDGWKRAKRRRRAGFEAQRGVAADGIARRWSMYGTLNVRAVEVIFINRRSVNVHKKSRT